MKSTNLGRVYKGTLLKFHETIDEEFERPQYQNMYSMETDFILQDIYNLDLIEQEIYGFSGTEDDSILDLLGKIDD